MPRLPPLRLLLVTFDLTDTQPGDKRYRQVDQSLRVHGLMFKPVNQLRLLLTSSSPDLIKGSMQQRIGRSETLLVMPVTAIPTWRIARNRQAEWRRFVDAVEEANVRVAGLTRSVDSIAE